MSLPPGLSPATVTVKVDSHGAYSTTFVLDPKAKQDGTLKVKVNVQVWWLWPLLILIIGAVFGYLTRWLMGSYRDRRILAARLVEARNSYSDRIAQRSPGIYPLNTWLGDFSDPIPGIPRPSDCGSDDLSGFAAACCEVHQARSADEIDAARTTVDRLSTDVDIWRKVNTALKTLDVSFQQSVPDPETRAREIPACADTRALINDQIVPQPADAAEAAKKIAALREQAEIVRVYERARRAWAQVPHEVPPYEEWDPLKIYPAGKSPLTCSPEEAKTLIRELADAALSATARVPLRAPRLPALERAGGPERGPDTLPAPVAAGSTRPPPSLGRQSDRPPRSYTYATGPSSSLSEPKAQA